MFSPTMHSFRLIAGLAVLALPLLAAPRLAQAQGSPPANQPGWFIPNGGGGGAASPQRAPASPQRATPRAAPVQMAEPVGQGPDQVEPVPPNMPMPPMPVLAPLAAGTPPPAAVIGVIGVPEVMRASTAGAEVEKVINERREKLQHDAQKEQALWRDMQQALLNQAKTLTPEQGRAREAELRNRVDSAQKLFRDRNTVIQQAAQYSLSQIERVLIQIVQQVAKARGMNVVLHRTQVALNTQEFDITDEVTAQLNAVLPHVVIPPDGMALTDFAKQLAASGALGPTPAAAMAAPGSITTTPAGAAPSAPAFGPRRQP